MRTPKVSACRADDPPSDEDTALCALSGAEIEPLEDAYMMLRGAFMPSVDRGSMIFKLDPDTDLSVIQLPDGSLALESRPRKTNPTLYALTSSVHDVICDLGGRPVDPEDEQRFLEHIPPEFR